jgi:hypothetical protein
MCLALNYLWLLDGTRGGHHNSIHQIREERPMRTKLLAAAIFVALTAPASAATCEYLILEVDKAIQESKASADVKDKAQRLRDEGEEQRVTGGQCETPLMQALQLLGK